ncbi:MULTISPECIES: aldehyde dehydrogenase family protein [unclassified Parafrankia]|uniref:aldehyde dehydrogenase family protein n=1 Tax=unclassified Parafrankia TaxID=2994368 RepID=UPI000DA58B8E|nr:MULTISPECIES: aldehyde dehydrogenase family protein [unclassified Parafrankia]TCJ31404.1 aldehyde dehydrogenase family protein [Parafrankia sp. BMG5.11]SQD95569.1 3-succinoylsemialdehyde-pyridine dehydrogenase [Parafrankia sp. Ea1.12]
MINQDLILIDGEWVPSSGTGVINVENPVTEEIIGTIPDGTPEDVDRAAAAAARAFDGWSRSTLDERAEVLRNLADFVEGRADEITEAIVQEIGEPLSIATGHQTLSTIKHLRGTADALAEVDFNVAVGDTLVHRAPVGVVGAITPWNVPLLMIAMKVGAAIAAGCTVVLKGTEIAPRSSFFFAEGTLKAGLPAGVVNLVSGTGPVVGEAIADHRLVDMVSITGSVRAGSRVMEIASRTVKRVGLELGGKSANVILEDADIAGAVTAGIADAFRNSGQVCGGLTRVLVPRARLAEAEDAARAAAESYALGDPFAEGTSLGPVVTRAQRDRVRELIQSGIDQGATLVTGGPEQPEGLATGYYVKPTIFSGTPDMRIAREEIFGPVVTILPYDTEDEAVAIANDSDYGLAGGVWAASPARAREVALRLRTGRIRINGSAVNPRAPHGGFKLSGIGRENGRFGIEEFLEYQSIG